jgi:hypothetical protein
MASPKYTQLAKHNHLFTLKLLMPQNKMVRSITSNIIPELYDPTHPLNTDLSPQKYDLH